MTKSTLNLVKESDQGKLYDVNGFLVPVLSGSWHEMGAQYGALMVDTMQATWDTLAAPGMKSGAISDADVKSWSHRAYTTCSTRMRHWYDGVTAGSGWTAERIGFLDMLMEYGVFQSKIHSFAGCTSIMSWGGHSSDGNMYIGRNMDWSATFNEFPQVLRILKPTDGSYKTAILGWPGMYCAFTTLNEHGAYLDVHDGTSMGGSLIYEDRPSSLSTLMDIMSEVASKDALASRINGMNSSTSAILSIADESSAASVECSSLGGNRLRPAEGESYVVVNTFLEDSWGLGKRETVSNSLRRFSNMTERLAENSGTVDAKRVRDLMDLRLFNEDGSFAENGGCTKPTKQDADLTTHQMVTDVKNRKVWLKVPVPKYFQDWTEINLVELWS